MDWDDLKYFLAAARLGTLTKAADALQSTPATVARRLARLETRLSARLFERKYTGYRLTAVGSSLLEKAEGLEDAILSMAREVSGADARAVGRVRLATTEDIATLVVGPHLTTFAQRFPDIELEISSARDVVSLARGDADIALRTVRPARGGLVIREAGWWRLALYAAQAYARKHELRPPVTDVAGLDIITWTEESARLRGGPWFEEHARNARIAFRANSRRVHHAACRAGIGIAILPCLLADYDPELVRLLPAERVISTRLWLLVQRDVSRIPRVRTCLDFLASIGPRSGR